MERSFGPDLKAKPMPEMPGRRATRAAALAVAALWLLSCHGRAPRPRNVIFILVDTLRADRLSAYGYGRPTSPNLDAFARGAVRFQAARSQAACTFPSVNSILTSRWPAAFLGQPEQKLGIPPGIPSLAEILRQRGFHTVAVSASAVVRRSPSRFNPRGGFDRGFDVFHEDCVWKSADCVNAAAAAHLKEGKQPLFLYLHYIDPHGPYQPPAAWRYRFATGAPDKEWVRKGNPNPIGDWLYKGKPNPGLTPADLQHLKDLYDEEISYFDSQFAGLLAALRREGLLDDSLVVFAADHGEELLEHGDVKHCRNLFDTSVHVPLLLKVPGVAARTVAEPVQNLDLVPTILDLLGIDARAYRFEGRSLRPEIEGKTPAGPAGETQYGFQGGLRSASDGRFKLIENLAGGPPALFDLEADPGETRNVLPAERRAYAGLRDALAAWLARSEGKGAADGARAAQEKLRSLGYIE
jgi:arylsulfatase A-like enzyme